MEAFADQATVAIQNARLIEELGRSREEISRAGRRRAGAARDRRRTSPRSATRTRSSSRPSTRRAGCSNRTAPGSTCSRTDTLTWAYASGATSIADPGRGRDMTFKVGEGVAGIAVQQGRTFLTDDYLADARFPHIEQSDELVERTGYVSVLAAPMRGEHGSLGLDLRQQPPDRRLRRGERAAPPGARRPGRDHDPERPPDRGAEPLPDPAPPAGRGGAEPARDRGPDLGDEGRPRRPPADRRRGRPPARRGRVPDRPDRRGFRPAEVGVPLVGVDAVRLVGVAGQPRREDRAGDLRPRRPRGARRVDRRLPQRPRVPPRLVVGQVRQGDRHQLGDVGAAPRRRPGLRGAHDLHPPERGLGDRRRAAHRGDREPGRDRDLDRPAHRGARPLQRGAGPPRRGPAVAARDRRPDHRDPRARAAPPAGRRRGQAARRRRRLDPRPRRSPARTSSAGPTTRGSARSSPPRSCSS